MLDRIRRILPHAAILICNMYIVFYLIDRVNKAMNFIDNDLTKGLLLILCVVGLFNFRETLIMEKAARRRPAQRQRPAGDYGTRRSYSYESGYTSRSASSSSSARRSGVSDYRSSYGSSSGYRSSGGSGRAYGGRSGSSSATRTRRY